jgi:hypothetical protein
MPTTLTASGFRGILISPTNLSKLFEGCILQSYEHFLNTSVNKFDFRKQSGCFHAIYTVWQTVQYFIKSAGTTISLCALDLSKVFDEVNHFGLFN